MDSSSAQTKSADERWHVRKRLADAEVARLCGLGLSWVDAKKQVSHETYRAAYRARLAGALYREIGAALGVTPGRASQIAARGERMARWGSRSPLERMTEDPCPPTARAVRGFAKMAEFARMEKEYGRGW
jgi:hypothetical protein